MLVNDRRTQLLFAMHDFLLHYKVIIRIYILKILKKTFIVYQVIVYNYDEFKYIYDEKTRIHTTEHIIYKKNLATLALLLRFVWPLLICVAHAMK